MSATTLVNGIQVQYGLGWVVDENKGFSVMGTRGGGCAWIDYYPAQHLTVIVRCNLTGTKSDEIIKKIAGFYF